MAAVVLPEVGVGQMEAFRRFQHDVVGNALAPPKIEEVYSYIRVSWSDFGICFQKTGSKPPVAETFERNYANSENRLDFIRKLTENQNQF